MLPITVIQFLFQAIERQTSANFSRFAHLRRSIAAYLVTSLHSRGGYLYSATEMIGFDWKAGEKISATFKV